MTGPGTPVEVPSVLLKVVQMQMKKHVQMQMKMHMQMQMHDAGTGSISEWTCPWFSVIFALLISHVHQGGSQGPPWEPKSTPKPGVSKQVF